MVGARHKCFRAHFVDDQDTNQTRLSKFLFSPRTYTHGTPPSSFFTCCSTLKRFFLQWKAFDLLDKMRYILWVLSLLEACDVTKGGRHLGRQLGFYQELEIGLKMARNGNLLRLTGEMTHK